MATSKALSIWRRFSSRAPHRLARRWLSTGVNAISRGLDFKRLPDHDLAAQGMGQGGADAHVHELPEEARRAGEVHHPVVGGAPGQFLDVLLRAPFHEDA